MLNKQICGRIGTTKTPSKVHRSRRDGENAGPISPDLVKWLKNYTSLRGPHKRKHHRMPLLLLSANAPIEIPFHRIIRKLFGDELFGDQVPNSHMAQGGNDLSFVRRHNKPGLSVSTPWFSRASYTSKLATLAGSVKMRLKRSVRKVRADKRKGSWDKLDTLIG